MDRAINKTTRKLIDAFDVHKNGSYQELKKGEWIAPIDKITNWDYLEKNKEELIKKEELFEVDGKSSVPVHHKKSSNWIDSKGRKRFTSPCFAIYPNSPADTYNGESQEHLKLKTWLFERLTIDDLNLIYSKGTKPHKYKSFVKLSDLDINWSEYQIPEETIKAHKKIRADILLSFNNRDALFGNGIIFEIQLTNQKEEKIYERTIDRALMGYSVVWISREDFEEDDTEGLYLKSPEINIIPFATILFNDGKKFIETLKNDVEEQCRYLDNKKSELILYSEAIHQDYEKIILEIKNNGENIYQELLKRLSCREAILMNKIELLEGNPFNGLIENYKSNLKESYDSLNNNYSTKIDDKLIQFYKITNNMINKLNYPLTFGICPRCNKGYMIKRIGKYGSFYSCSNWKKDRTGCNHIINIKEDDNGEITED